MKQIFVIAAAVLLFLCSAGLAANYPEYGIQTPAGWTQRKNLSQDLLHQIVEPGNNAMIEVYYNKGSVGSLENMADQWEGAGRQRGTPYLTYKHTSKHLSYAYKNTPAIQRTYSGVHNGSTLGCIVNFMQYDGFIVIVVGIYPKDYKAYGGPLLSAFSTFTPGRAPKKTAGPVPKQPRPETKGTVSPEQMVKTYYGILESEDLNALETILIASPGGRLSHELGAYRLVFSSVDQKIRDLDIMEKKYSADGTGCIVKVRVNGEVIRGDGKERFKINEPFMVCMRRARNNNWKIERVFRASAMRLSTLGITAENALKKLMGD